MRAWPAALPTQFNSHCLQELCGSAVADSYKPVAQLNLLTPPEVTQVLHTFNAWDLPYTELLDPERQTIHGMFEYFARHTPDAPSLTFGVRSPFTIWCHELCNSGSQHVQKTRPSNSLLALSGVIGVAKDDTDLAGLEAHTWTPLR
jgi:hypothetical protein